MARSPRGPQSALPLAILSLLMSSICKCDQQPFIHRYPFFYPENTNVSELLVPFSAIDSGGQEFNHNITYSFRVKEVTWNERAVDYFERNVSELPLTSNGQWTNEQIQEYFAGKEVFPYIWNPFRMDSDSGTLYLQSQLDYELIVSYQLEVVTTDKEISSDNQVVSSRNSTAYVFIHVTDVNDNRPLFVNINDIERGMEVYENNLIGHIVGEVRAVDFDSLPNSQITFIIDPVLDYQNFTISAKTGQIQALDSFDFEKKSEYSIKITAKNDDLTNSSLILKIRVKDINEWIDGRTPDAISFGIVTTIVFFVVLMIIISTSFILVHKQKEKEKKKDIRGSHAVGVVGVGYGGHVPSSSMLSVPRKMPTSSLPPTMKDLRNMSLKPTATAAHLSFRASLHSSSSSHVVPPRVHNHSNSNITSTLNHQLRSTQYSNTAGMNGSPDVVEQQHQKQQQQKQQVSISHSHSQAHPHPPPATVCMHSARVPPAPPSSFATSNGCDNYSEILANEPFDLENASSIAPSDIDLAFRFKGYHPRIPPVPPHPPHPSSTSDAKPDHRHVPLARLSPSVSELTAPRILTLQDLSPSQPGLPSKVHHSVQKMPCHSRRPVTGMSTVSSDEDDDGGNTVDSFTSSEYEDTYQLKSNRGAVYDRGVW